MADKQKKAVHEFCSGGGCCPVLEEYEDGTVAIVDEGKELVSMNADTAVRLADRIYEITGRRPCLTPR